MELIDFGEILQGAEHANVKWGARRSEKSNVTNYLVSDCLLKVSVKWEPYNTGSYTLFKFQCASLYLLLSLSCCTCVTCYILSWCT